MYLPLTQLQRIQSVSNILLARNTTTAPARCPPQPIANRASWEKGPLSDFQFQDQSPTSTRRDHHRGICLLTTTSVGFPSISLLRRIASHLHRIALTLGPETLSLPCLVLSTRKRKHSLTHFLTFSLSHFLGRGNTLIPFFCFLLPALCLLPFCFLDLLRPPKHLADTTTAKALHCGLGLHFCVLSLSIPVYLRPASAPKKQPGAYPRSIGRT